MRDNGIDPDGQWLLPYAISDSIEPVYFPAGSPGSGAQNCFSTNEPAARKFYVEQLLSRGNINETLQNLILHKTTGISKDLVPGYNFKGEIRLISAITLKEVLSPFEFVDYLESDIQQSEIVVFPPFPQSPTQKGSVHPYRHSRPRCAQGTLRTVCKKRLDGRVQFRA